MSFVLKHKGFIANRSRVITSVLRGQPEMMSFLKIKQYCPRRSREWVDGSWVMGQMGHENRMGHMGHGSLGVDP